jgi:hypothetical protein
LGTEINNVTMNLVKIAEVISRTGRHSSHIDESVARVENLDNGSEYIVEEFGAGSFQIRQAVVFDCEAQEDLNFHDIYVLCSRINERFSGCKCFIDKWGVLINATDIIDLSVSTTLVETLLDQVEFVSQVTPGLVEDMRSTGLPGEADIDSAFEVPPLQ